MAFNYSYCFIFDSGKHNINIQTKNTPKYKTLINNNLNTQTKRIIFHLILKEHLFSTTLILFIIRTEKQNVLKKTKCFKE